MKKKTKIILVSLLVIVIGVLALKFIPFGTKMYKMPNSNLVLEVPSMSIFKEECCMFYGAFISFSTVSMLEKQLDEIMSKYENYECSGQKYYYDKEHDLTVTSYSVISDFPFNRFSLIYEKGKVMSCS